MCKRKEDSNNLFPVSLCSSAIQYDKLGKNINTFWQNSWDCLPYEYLTIHKLSSEELSQYENISTVSFMKQIVLTSLKDTTLLSLIQILIKFSKILLQKKKKKVVFSWKMNMSVRFRFQFSMSHKQVYYAVDISEHAESHWFITTVSICSSLFTDHFHFQSLPEHVTFYMRWYLLQPLLRSVWRSWLLRQNYRNKIMQNIIYLDKSVDLIMWG